MSEQHPDKSTATTATPSHDAPAKAGEPGGAALSDLMAHGDKGRTAARGPDLDQQALRAAEQALAEGERALANARAQLQPTPVAAPANGRRELLLRLLLAVNVLAMVVVAMLPAPGGSTTTATPPAEPVPHAAPTTPPAAPRTDELWDRAIAASQRRDYATAVALLERYLAESPRMAPSQQMSVFLALSHYASKSGDFKKAQEFDRRARALDQSHSLPEDLVAMAQAAAESGDQANLRRAWARFLLQQKQIPSSLYPQVATAYLQLGDSYRHEANEAAEKQRLAELAETERRLREEAKKAQEAPK